MPTSSPGFVYMFEYLIILIVMIMFFFSHFIMKKINAQKLVLCNI